MTELRQTHPAVLRSSVRRSLVKLSRPRQWHKALMLFAAPTAAGVITQVTPVVHALVAAVGFTFLSIAIYAVNDVRDAADDRCHPIKQHRPVASYSLSPAVALAWALVTAIFGLTIVGFLGISTFLLGLGYLVAQLAYVYGLKHIAVVDVVLVALGFVLRAAAGGTAAGVPVSNWFLLVSLFGALFLVAGKRRAEQGSSVSDARSRPVLAAYSAAWLDQLVTVALLGTSLSYGLWAFQYLGDDVIRQLLAVSFLPFLTGLLRYGFLVSTGRGELPEYEIFRDRVLLVAGAAWAGTVAVGLYA